MALISLLGFALNLTEHGDSQLDFEGNFKCEGHKMSKTVAPIDNRVSLGENFFFNDVESSTEQANLDYVLSFPYYHHFVLLFWFSFVSKK